MKRYFSPNSPLLDTAIDFKYKLFPAADNTSKIIPQISLIDFETISPKMFFLNIQLLDSDLPSILAELLLLGYKYFKSTTSDLLALIENANPIGYNQTSGRHYYKKKLGDLLYHLALGMNSEMAWTGDYSTNIEFIFERNYIETASFNIYDRSLFEEYLINNTKIEQSYSEVDEFKSTIPQAKESNNPNYCHSLYKEVGEYYLKLNLRIQFI